MRTDPTDTGGLFVGRRPGTAPVQLPHAARDAAATARQRIDGSLADALLAAMVVVNLLLLGPAAGRLPVGRLAGRST